jgi:hypothetical protein
MKSAVYNKCIIMQDNEVYKEEWEIRYKYNNGLALLHRQFSGFLDLVSILVI